MYGHSSRCSISLKRARLHLVMASLFIIVDWLEGPLDVKRGKVANPHLPF